MSLSFRLRNIIRRRGQIIRKADDFLIAGLGDVQKNLADVIVEKLSKFERRGGALAAGSATNTQMLATFENNIKTALKRTNYRDLIKGYLSNFDEIAKLSQQTAQAVAGRTVQASTVNALKRIEIERIALQLVEPQGIQSNIVDPIKRILFKSVTTGTDYASATAEIETFVNGVQGQNGFMQRYTTQLARDSVNRYAGTINNVIKAEFELDGFVYVGSLIETSREVCNELVRGDGKFQDLQKDGAYRIADLPIIVSRMLGEGGVNPALTVDNFFELRGGYNCRHEAIPIKLTERQLALWEDN
jgi:hypothetical protein